MNLLDKSKGYIFFIRHGQTEWNVLKKLQGRDEIPLNEVGISQAKNACLGIKNACLEAGIKFDKVISSPLSRASVTGKMIAEAVSCDNFFTDERIIERDFGVLSGSPYGPQSSAIVEDVPEIQGLEPMDEVITRLNSFIKDNVSMGECVIVVTHGSVTKIFAKNARHSPSVTNFNELLSNCHMVIYSFDGNEVLLEGYNISPNELSEFILKNME